MTLFSSFSAQFTKTIAQELLASSHLITVSAFLGLGTAALILILDESMDAMAAVVGVLSLVQLIVAPRESVSESNKAQSLVYVTLAATGFAALAGAYSLYVGALLQFLLYGIVTAFEFMALSIAKKKLKQSQAFDNLFSK